MGSIQITFEGVSPLVVHNIRLADPDDEFAKAIKAITGKRTKTEEDRRAIERLEWYGGLYTAPGVEGPVMPTANLRKCLIQAAKVKKMGVQVQRALHFKDVYVPIEYDGPKNIDGLHADPSYHLRAAVGVSGKRTMRVRPMFPQWRITAQAEFIPDAMDPDALSQVVELAGQIEGLCDNRVNGYGRFEGSVRNGATV